MAQALAVGQPGLTPSPAGPSSSGRHRSSGGGTNHAARGGQRHPRRRPGDVINLLDSDSDTDSGDIEVVAVRAPAHPPPHPPSPRLGAASPGAARGRKRERGAASAASAAAVAAGGMPGKLTFDPLPPPLREPSPEPAFKCAICLEAIKQMASTPCGHVYCYDCLKAAVQVHKKCPKCRKTVQLRQIHKIYLN